MTCSYLVSIAPSRLYPHQSSQFSPLGRVVSEFVAEKVFQNVATHVK